MINNVEYLCTVFFYVCHQYSSFNGEKFFQSFYPFFLTWLLILLLSFENFLYILDRSLSDNMFCKYFSQFMIYLFIPLMSFEITFL